MIGNYDVQVWRLVGVSDFRSICGLGGTERPAIRLPWREEAIFCDRREDLETGFAGAAERSADLAMSYPTPVRNRYLKDGQLLARGESAFRPSSRNSCRSCPVGRGPGSRSLEMAPGPYSGRQTGNA